MSRTYPTSQMQLTTSHTDPGIAGASQSRPSGVEQPNLWAHPDPSGCRRLPGPTCPQNPAHPRKVSPKRPERRQPSLTNPRKQRHGIAEASRTTLAKPRVPVTNQSHRPRYRRSVPKSTTTPDGRCRRSVPTDGNQARTSPRKLRTPTARYRRSVPSETGQAT